MLRLQRICSHPQDSESRFENGTDYRDYLYRAIFGCEEDEDGMNLGGVTAVAELLLKRMFSFDLYALPNLLICEPARNLHLTINI